VASIIHIEIFPEPLDIFHRESLAIYFGDPGAVQNQPLPKQGPSKNYEIFV
jgi:hypothetical protein